MASTYSGVSGFDAKIIGGAPSHGDIVVSAVFAVVFFALAGFSLFRYRNPIFRCLMLVIIAIAAIMFGIGFSIRAGAGNAITQSGLVGLQVCFILGHVLMLDVIITLTRDVIVEVSPTSIHIFFTFMARLSLIVAAIISCIGHSWDVDPGNESQAHQSSKLALWGAIIQFIAIVLSLAIFILSIIFHRLLGVPTYILLGMNMASLGPSLYLFTLVAVDDPNWSLSVKDKVYFIITFGVMQGTTVALASVLNLNVWFAQIHRPYMALRTMPLAPV